jgi:hypothetical protein
VANDPVSIANRALTLLGVHRIVSLTDASAPARSIASVFDQVRDSELRAHVWNFALKRATLAALTAVPPFQFSLAYQIPTDCLQVVMVGDFYIGVTLTDYRTTDESAYAIEGGQILTNPIRFVPVDGLDPELTAPESSTGLPPTPPPLHIRYIGELTNTTQMDPLFCEMLACKLAETCCMDLTESNDKLQGVAAFYKRALQRAVAINAIEKPPEPEPDDSWIISRIAR